MSNRLIETLAGAAVIAVAIGFAAYSYSRAGIDTVEGYEIKASFNRIDGLVVGNDVRISGVKVGSVTGQELDPDTYMAVVKMSVRADLSLPMDSSAKVASDGLLGGKFVSIEPGGDIDMIQAGGEIEYTQGSVNLEDLIGQVIYSSTSSSE
ncbi:MULTISPECIES: outer membrane lipid asymmetry maintenance protein MlaD [Thalassospira]|jgi:phospholipid/cholesterol/gamma-HCH transport system substrate-binding protein|uniref:Outer membrane lipid asymmetry maintenance protein MlaD n=1 Tax=Thalassospira povalilytica TaxID=732237 RepID=A0A8I1M8Q4_9PROT|nr:MULTISPECIES: outer membrane lipid asymmetry maintenance protein MlaD [Thalassospira]MEE3043888.1 outer membrane lipid asymmetry maintenance protein MlaD [Pseudomonadota bacterium]RCK27322.1 ABC transporter substrate-binding protein [Thalassospira profundimaris]KZB65063.1 outer membrane lipid asymmetry maintenance protein MlaD [Thalassospira sp. MCCC 1A02491]MBN8196902.1 outer membrane lipid asymmetry maintenance protein MlaD [Thalassospira povalilytica]MBO6772279.1 outer membrane lipid asy|tara:strand:- start:1543 stop:1995 length:453 start_codon:yes stop_codon:yes gene_type:complete